MTERKLNITGDVVTSVVQAGSIIAQTINSIQDVNKRRQAQEALASLSNNQQLQLAQQIADQNNRNDQVNILLQLAATAAANKSRNTTILYVAVGALALGTLIAVLWFLKKK